MAITVQHHRDPLFHSRSAFTRLHGKPLLRKIAALLTILGPLVFLLTGVVLNIVQPGHDPVYDTISSLVWGEYGWLQTTGFYLFAFVLFIFMVRLYFSADHRKSLQLAEALLLLLSLGFIIISVCPTNAPGASTTFTVTLHRFTAGLICGLFPMICLAVAVGLRGSPRRKLYRFSIFAGILGIVLAVVGMIVIVNDLPWKGAVERCILVNGVIWMEVMGIAFLSAHRVRSGRYV